MERMIEGFSMLTWQHYLFAASVAYVITYIYRVFDAWKQRRKNGEKTYVIKTLDRQAIDRCKELFPIDVLAFGGRNSEEGRRSASRRPRKMLSSGSSSVSIG